MTVAHLLRRAARRLQAVAALDAAAVGLTTFAAAAAIAGPAGFPQVGAAIGVPLGLGLAGFSLRRAAQGWGPAAVAAWIERRAPGSDNLLVTAASLALGTSDATERMRAEVLRQADARAAALDPTELVRLHRPLWTAIAAALGAFALAAAARGGPENGGTMARAPLPAPALGSVRVTVTQPSYLQREPIVVENPDQVTILAGGQLRIEAEATTEEVWLERADAARARFEPAGDRAFTTELTPSESSAIVIAAGTKDGAAAVTRVLQVLVTVDETPRVTVTQPGRDLAFTTPDTVVDVTMEAVDAEGLRGLRLAWVRMSGSGESFAFDEGDAPVAIERAGPTRWRGRARLQLAALAIEDGDSLIYRGLVRDSNPAADWVASDAFTIDVGKRLEFAGAGFAVPEEDRRYAISQQMVIVRTERLLASRPGLDDTAWNEQTRLLAVEQRMVRSEVVFLSGGEVQDEVEEAEHSHELQEGRLENTGRAEMLRAMNEMSRAEAALNAGDAREALIYERRALAALQRAFDRRRYFLRTLGERSRIDPSRRLSGDRARAASRARVEDVPNQDPVAIERALTEALAVIARDGSTPEPAVLARLASLDPADPRWRDVSARLAAAATGEARREAARRGMVTLAARARQRLGLSAPAFEAGDLRGWWGREWPDGTRR